MNSVWKMGPEFEAAQYRRIAALYRGYAEHNRAQFGERYWLAIEQEQDAAQMDAKAKAIEDSIELSGKPETQRKTG